MAEPITIEYILENKLTPVQCVQYFKPEWTVEQCDFFVWEQTCFPFDTVSFIKQLNESFIGKNNVQEKLYTEQDMLNAIKHGFEYHRDSQNDGIDVPKGNKLQWLQYYNHIKRNP